MQFDIPIADQLDLDDPSREFAKLPRTISYFKSYGLGRGRFVTGFSNEMTWLYVEVHLALMIGGLDEF